ncbi:MAG: O-antigen ligase family protein [Candidatus Hydrogenedentes bacterium]|nr:O-antigen ligase family protein [Candidatus Hydrogenedentota bacterium]
MSISVQNGTSCRPDPAPAHAWAAAALIVLSTLAFSLHLQSFLHAKEAIWCAAIVPLAWYHLRIHRGGLAIVPLTPLLAAALCGVAGAATAGSPAGLIVTEVLRMAVLIGAAAILGSLAAGDRAWPVIRGAFVCAASLAALLGLLQYGGLLAPLLPSFAHYDQAMYSVFGNQDALGSYIVLALPFLIRAIFENSAVPAWRTFIRWILFALLLSALILSGARSAWLAALGGMGALFWAASPAGRVKLGYAAVAAGLLAAVIIFAVPEVYQKLSGSLESTDAGVRGRLWFWAGAIRMIGDHPILGVGPGAYAYWSPLYQGAAAQQGGHYHNELLTLHPHNDMLELLATCGAAGVLAGVICVMKLRNRVRRDTELAAFGVTALMIGLTNPLWAQSAHLILVMVCWARLVRAPHVKDPDPAVHGGAILRFGVFAGGAAIAYVFSAIVPGYLLTRAEQGHLHQAPAATVESCYNTAVRWAPFPHEALRSRGIFLWEQGRPLEAVRDLESALGGLDTGELYWFLGQARLAAGDRRGASQSFENCLQRWPWYVPAQKAFAQLKG